MKRFCLLFVLLFGLTAHAADHAAEDALKSSLKGKDLYLRNYSAHSAIAYHIENNKLISSRPGVLALTKLHVDDVKIKGADVTIHAQRSGTEDVLDPHAFHAISRVELKINLGTADPAKALAALPHLLFYDNYDDALAGIPEPWRKSVIRTLNPTSNEPACHCSAYLDDNGKSVELPEGSVKPPNLLYAPQVEYSADAGPANVQGTVVVGLIVQADGSLGQQMWLYKTLGLGYGLDEKTIQSVRKYKFAPATKDGKPVATVITVEDTLHTY